MGKARLGLWRLASHCRDSKCCGGRAHFWLDDCIAHQVGHPSEMQVETEKESGFQPQGQGKCCCPIGIELYEGTKSCIYYKENKACMSDMTSVIPSNKSGTISVDFVGWAYLNPNENCMLSSVNRI